LKPAPFIYHDPRSASEACELLAAHDNARVLAGGQSLMPDAYVTAEYRRHLARVLTYRVLEQAASRAELSIA